LCRLFGPAVVRSKVKERGQGAVCLLSSIGPGGLEHYAHCDRGGDVARYRQAKRPLELAPEELA
jgi:hypothetical protein